MGFNLILFSSAMFTGFPSVFLATTVDGGIERPVEAWILPLGVP